ncbi:hypothetical protein Q5H91_04715 [Sphingomonas sp. KR1UV-12]|uniref:Cellulose biosynthesis protein BcsF n=1 Tax=Sphingomonas aurea TaxID=3063994 RepID=A0ABT9EHQ3_9SPHN|nr:hypothetical protein [Sphingomonas sp. KR1UV-12]MDP1026505.1 hypothetical protein [Sphingomonas sp. KR1UV-12]
MLIEAIVLGVAILALLAAALLWGERIERRRRARWWHDYFHGGGLARALIRRWNGTRRLTYRPPEKPD